MNPELLQAKADFLNLFPDNDRAAVTNTILKRIRAGVTETPYLLAALHDYLANGGLVQSVAILEANPQTAAQFVQYCLQYERLTQPEKDALKRKAGAR